MWTKLKRIFCLLSVLLLCGCTPATMPEAAPLPLPVMELPSAEEGSRTFSAVLYYPNAPGSQLARRTAEMEVEGNAWKGQVLLKTLLEENPEDDTLSPLFRGYGRLLEVSRGGELVVVDVGLNTSLLSEQEFFAGVVALTNTVTENLGAEYVSILFNGRHMAATGLLTNPMTRQTQSLDVLWLLHEAVLEGAPVPAGFESQSPVVLFFKDTTGKFLMPEVQAYDGDGSNRALDVLVSLLKGPANSSRLVAVAGNMTLTPAPEITRIPGSGGDYRVSVWMVSGGSGKPDSRTLQMLCGAVTLSLFHSLDNVAMVSIYLDGTPVSDYQGTRLSVKGEFSRKDFSGYLGETLQLYFPDRSGNALVGVSRAVEQQEAWSPEACMRALLDGPLKGDSSSAVTYAFPLEVTQEDLLDVIVADECAYVNLSEEFAAACEGMTAQRERQMVYSVVNSFTEMENINRVCFLVEGKVVQTLGGTLDVSGTFWRNPGIIQGD